jgi:hypothetical protein
VLPSLGRCCCCWLALWWLLLPGPDAWAAAATLAGLGLLFCRHHNNKTQQTAPGYCMQLQLGPRLRADCMLRLELLTPAPAALLLPPLKCPNSNAPPAADGSCCAATYQQFLSQVGPLRQNKPKP